MAGTYALFDEAGKFLAGRVLSEAESSMQIELSSGKRSKVKAANVLLRFDKPGPEALLAEAQQESAGIELDLAWEFAPEGDFGFRELAADYFGGNPDSVRQAAMLIRLHEAPHYFRRAGKGQFRKAPEDIVKAALAAIERKAQQAAQIEQWASELEAGRCPEPVAAQIHRILFKPDKNAPETKAVLDAARRRQIAPLTLLLQAGAIGSPYQFHWQRFLFEQFPKGVAHAAAALPPPFDASDLPLADVEAFSIDDASTTEIDDALSVRGLGTGTVTLGIHIAAPALALAPGTPADIAARARMSTVYLPGGKLTMLPSALVDPYTLTVGSDRPALSLYVTFDEASLAIGETRTVLERVPVVANLRHDELDGLVTAEALEAAQPAGFPFARELAFGWRLARHLKAAREVVRGKPEVFGRPDFTFSLRNPDGSALTGLPTGDERVEIRERARGAPLDLIVSEAMILANSHWGEWLRQLGVPGLYRSQASLAPGIKVRMGTKALPHAGLGVPSYAWSTSPLRRYVDMVNQWQLIAAVRHGQTAALVAPFKPKDVELLAILSNFDAAYAAYQDFQRGIERFWTLRWLQQQGIEELDATVLKDGLVRADTLPLVFRTPGTEPFARGTPVRVRVAGIDLLTLDLHSTLLARRDTATPITGAADDTEGDDDLAAAAAPLTVALADEPEATPAADDGAPAATPPT